MLKLELKKIKFINILLVSLIIPLLANAFGLINYMGNKASLTHEWQSLWAQVSLFYFSFFYIPLIAIVVASLWSVEHKAGLKFIRLSPKKNMSFILAKMILAFIIVSLCQIYFFFLFYIGGKFIANFSSINFSIYFYYIIMSILLSIPIIAIFSALAIKIKSFGIIVLLSSIFTILGLGTAYKALKIVGLSFLAIESNNLRFINTHDLIFLVLFSIVESIVSLYISKNFLKYEN
ncbi:ABC transporter permease [Ezakiella coagulans]|uniref:ABC transporter permease n=1 Tax=Ezakiella coagulans TaxID=46507 RepID=UPI00201485E2|nr:ABC transporter permease [Ezakiella coagulans]UQK61144.1 ABC transporter permease [Ezakiella coagulans]